jgi:hypothetical protein
MFASVRIGFTGPSPSHSKYSALEVINAGLSPTRLFVAVDQEELVYQSVASESEEAAVRTLNMLVHDSKWIADGRRVVEYRQRPILLPRREKVIEWKRK